jgi:hypothetical protein
MFDATQVFVVGGAGIDEGPRHRAIAVASQLYAAGRWDGKGRIAIRDPCTLHRLLQLSEAERFDAETCTTVHAHVHELREGDDFEVRPLSAEMAGALGVAKANALETLEQGAQ